MQNLPVNTLRAVLFFTIILCSLSPSNVRACDTTPTQTAGNIQYAGDGLYTIDIQNCIGDAGSENGFSVGVSDVNIVGFSPTNIENILNGNTATGSFNGGLVTYDYVGAGYFVEAGHNTCFWTTITVDGFPDNAQITLSGVNTPGGCAILYGDTQVTPVIEVPTCGEMFYDTGGPDGAYTNSENYSVVICGGGGPVTIQFTEFQLALDGDILTIYDNDGTSGSSDFYTGGASPGTVTSTNPSNCLTIAFESNSFGEAAAGWEAEVTCATPCPNGLEVDVLSNASTCLTSGDGEVSTLINGGIIPYNFEWNTGDTSDKLENLGAGTYIVTVTDGNGCIAVDSTTVSVSVSIESSITGTMVDCGMDNGTATISVTGGGQPPYDFIWNTGSGAEFISGLSIGDYSVTITDTAGCQGTAAIALINDTDLDASVTVLDSVSCFGASDGEASAIVTGGTGIYTYFWDSGENTETATQLSAGGHALTVTDAENCSVVDSFFVEEPLTITAITGSNPVSCFGGNDGIAWVIPDGGIGNFTYEWSSGQLENTVTGLSSGDYIVSITSSTGCVATYEVEVEQPPSSLILNFQTDDPTCGGYADGNAQVQVDGGTPTYTYAWSSGETASTANALIAGTNYVTVSDANGCIHIDSVMLNEPSPISYSFETEDVSCFGDDIGTLTISDISGGNGDGTYTYSIDGENYVGTPTFIRLEAGDYEFYVQDSEGCTTTQAFAINQLPELTVDLGEDIELAYGDSDTLNPTINQFGIFEYQWTTQSPDSTLSCTDCLTPIATPLYDTDYTLLVTDANGCTATDKIRVNVRKTQQVFIPTAFTPNGDGANDVFMIHGDSGTVSAYIRIFDRAGELIYNNTNATLNNPEDGWDGKYRGNDSPPGVYVYFVDVEFIGGETLPYKGQFTLIR